MRSDRTSLTGRAARTGRAGRRAFTLIELMVVIAIIAILAGLLMPAIGAALNKSHEARVQNMIHQCEIAATSFFNDHGDYPPSTWAGMFQMLKYDADGDGTVGDYTNPADPDYIVVNFPGFPLPGGDPRTNNQGIEVFLACVATSNGGPYMQPSDWQLKNTDADTDNANSDIAKATNWYFRAPAPQPLLELADWWGNPLIYIHNRNYAETDGVTGMTSLQYLGANQETIQVWSRYSNGFQTGTPPKLDSYQLFSLGSNGVENLTPVGATYVTPAQWTLKQMHFLANWEE